MPTAPTVAALLALLFIAAIAPQPAAARLLIEEGDDDYNPGNRTNIKSQYIVMFKPKLQSRDAPDVRDNIARTHGLKIMYVYDEFNGFAFTIKGNDAFGRNNVLAKLRQHVNVSVVAADASIDAIGTLAAGETPDTGVLRIGAVSGTTVKNAAGVGVAVVDTGIQLTHPDLNAVNGITCMSTKKTATANDDNGHGTHCAGTIGAKNSGSGVVGVAPGTKLWAVKVLDSTGSGSWSSIICGLNWVAKNAAAQNIKVVSMSLGGTGTAAASCATATDALQQAICAVQAKNVSVVVAAGNSNANLATSVPAAYPSVLTVTAMADSDGKPGGKGGATTCYSNADDTAAGFSNWASNNDTAAQAHTIAAPGVCIRSTYLNSGYAIMSGTSMATPHVAGTAALCYNNGGLSGPCAGKTPAQVIQILRSNAQTHATAAGDSFSGDPSRPISGRYYGYLDWAGSY